MRIIAYKTEARDGQVLLQESTGEAVLSNDLMELFPFLLNEFEEEGQCLKVCWDLDQTVSLFLRLLGASRCEKIRATKRGHFAPFDLFYVPEKVFSVVHIPTRTKTNLYGIEQYFTELEEPDDVREIEALGNLLVGELRKMDMIPSKLTSPVAIYEEAVLKKLDLPKLKDIPVKVSEYAAHCAWRLWIESHQLGNFSRVYGYDMSSAFPRAAQHLVDFRDCYIKQSKEYQPNAVYGYGIGDITIYDWVMVHPILRETEEGLDTRVGTYPDYINKKQMDFINKWGIGEYKLKDGYWIIPVQGRTLKEPLYKPMETLLQYKQGGWLQRLIAKRSSTGICGKMLEEREDEFGPYANFVWAAEVSSQVALEVGEFLYSHGIGPGDNEGYSHLIHIGVDGVMLDKPVEEIVR